MDLLCNDRLLRLIECIESIKSDVKKKMTSARACDSYTKVTRQSCRRNLRRRIVPRITRARKDKHFFRAMLAPAPRLRARIGEVPSHPRREIFNARGGCTSII